MKRINIITKDRILKSMIYITLSPIAWFINWVLEKILNNVTDKIASLKINSLMELIEKIAPYAFMIFVSIGIIVWVYWILKDRFKYKKLYYDHIDTYIKYFKIIHKHYGHELDYLTLGENFSPYELRILEYSEDEIKKCAGQLLKKQKIDESKFTVNK